MLSGAVVSVNAAQLIAESDAGLEPWVSVLFGATKPTSKSVLRRSLMLPANGKQELLKILLELYMNGG